MIKLEIELRDSTLIAGVSQKNFIVNITESGRDGKDGKTPVFGIDYFNENDKQKIISEIEQAQIERIDEFDINLLF